jgi:hypothetical protein
MSFRSEREREMAAELNGRTWSLAPAVIDHVAWCLGVDRSQACLALKDALFEGRVRARGLVAGGNVSEIPTEYWRYAVIDPSGFAIDLHSMKKLQWFELCADDVLRVWPAAANPTARRVGGRPMAADWQAHEEALNQEIDLVGLPRKDGVPGWQTQTDAIKFVERQLGEDESPGTERTRRRDVAAGREETGRKVVSGRKAA